MATSAQRERTPPERGSPHRPLACQCSGQPPGSVARSDGNPDGNDGGRQRHPAVQHGAAVGRPGRPTKACPHLLSAWPRFASYRGAKRRPPDRGGLLLVRARAAARRRIPGCPGDHGEGPVLSARNRVSADGCGEYAGEFPKGRRGPVPRSAGASPARSDAAQPRVVVPPEGCWRLPVHGELPRQTSR